MTKAELLALGLPEERMKEFQDIYHRDLRKTAQRMVDSPERGADELRNAIIPMLHTIKSASSLRKILANVTHHYLKDYREQESKEAMVCPTIDTIEPAQIVERPLTPESSVTA